jgi:hypothetical protein
MVDLEYINGGNLVSPQLSPNSVNIILHCCNDIPVMGAGVAKALYMKWPQVKEQYLLWKEITDLGFHTEEEKEIDNHAHRYKYHFPDPYTRRFGLGNVQLVAVECDTDTALVANMIGQHGVGADDIGIPPVRYAAFERAFERLSEMNEESEVGITIHVPYLMGCDLAGGVWNKVEALLVENFAANDIPVKVYDLFGKYDYS